MACGNGGPPFAKVRGLDLYLQRLKADGVQTIGYVDTAISMAGWGIAYFAYYYNLHAVLFYPEYKGGYRYNQQHQIRQWDKFGAEIHPLQNPTIRAININKARSQFYSRYPEGHWLLDGLKFPETVDEVEKEAILAINKVRPTTIITCIGSGMMAAGVLQGAYKAGSPHPIIIGVLVHNALDPVSKKYEIVKYAGMSEGPSLFHPHLSEAVRDFVIYRGKYKYSTPANVVDAPFPCNPYYDLKAYEFLLENIDYIEKPILFWNIGA